MLVLQSTLVAFNDSDADRSPLSTLLPPANPFPERVTAMRMPAAAENRFPMATPLAMSASSTGMRPCDACDFDDPYEETADPLADYLDMLASYRRDMAFESEPECRCPYCARHRAVMG